MKHSFLMSALAFLLVFVVSCAPGANSGFSRFPLKLGEVWQMQAFKPGNTDSQTFPIELYSEPELDKDGEWVVDIEAGKFEGGMSYDPRDSFLFAVVQLTRGSDPEYVLCGFSKAEVGAIKYVGTSLFAKGSELTGSNRLPAERYAHCELSKIK